MKVCIISSTFPPQLSRKICGIGDYTYNLSQQLSGYNFKIDILTSNDYAGEKVLTPSLHVFPIIEEWDLKSLGKIRAFLVENQYEIVCLQYQPEIFGSKWSLYNSLLPLCNWGGRKFITIFHTLFYPSPLSPTRIHALFIASLSDQIIVTNEPHKRELLRMYPPAKKKNYLVPVGSNILPSDEIWVDRLSIRDRIRKQMNITDNEILISNFGLIYSNKSLETLVDAVNKLHDVNYDAKLLIIGHISRTSIHYYQEIKQLIQENGLEHHVTWVHDCSMTEVSEYLFASDIYAVPYKDGLSTRRTSALSGMIHGLPTVSTYGEGTSEMFSSGENVVLVPPNDVDLLFQALLDLVESPEKRDALGNAAKELSLEFSWPSVAQQIADIFKSN